MKKPFLLIVPFLLLGSNLHAADGFEAVQCGGNIPKALIGKKMSNEPVSNLEARHKNLALKDLGSSEVSDTMNSISWSICGNEYMILEANDVVKDVLPFPSHSKSAPAVEGFCELKGQKMKEMVVGVLGNPAEAVDKLPAKQAWKIDEKTAKFVPLPTADLRCPRSEIITADGGK